MNFHSLLESEAAKLFELNMSDESEFESSEAEIEAPLAPTESADSWKLKGDDAYRSKEYQKAIEAYTNAIDQIGRAHV